MATWHGVKRKLELEFVHKDPNHWDTVYDQVDANWSYNTTSDCLTIVYEHPDMKNGKHEKLLGLEWAKAELVLLADWMRSYYSKEELLELLRPILEKE